MGYFSNLKKNTFGGDTCLLHLTHGVKPRSATHSCYLQWWCPCGLLQDDLSQWSRRDQNCPKLQHLPMHCVDRNTDQNPPTTLSTCPGAAPQQRTGTGYICGALYSVACKGWTGLNGVRRQSIVVCVRLWTTPDKHQLLMVPQYCFWVICNPPWSRAVRTWVLPTPCLWAGGQISSPLHQQVQQKNLFTKNSPAPVDYSSLH